VDNFFSHFFLVCLPTQCRRSPLQESVTNGDAATALVLITAGADVNCRDYYGIKPFDKATDKACCDLYEHHSASLTLLIAEPTALVSAVIAECACLSVLGVSDQMPILSLHPYQLEPPYHWASPAARAAVLAWAQEAFIVLLAMTIKPFSELPDDCAGDIMEFFGSALSRRAIHHFATPSLSSEAHAWVRTVLTSSITVSVHRTFHTFLILCSSFDNSLSFF